MSTYRIIVLSPEWIIKQLCQIESNYFYVANQIVFFYNSCTMNLLLL